MKATKGSMMKLLAVSLVVIAGLFTDNHALAGAGLIGLNLDTGGGDGGDGGDGGGEGDGNWIDSVPEAMRGMFEGAESMEAGIARYGVPESYTLPEGADAEDMKEMVEMAKEAGLSQAAFETMMKFDSARIEALPKIISEMQAEQAQEELNAFKSEIGEEKFKELVGFTAPVMKQAPQEVKDLLNSTGLANSPVLIRWIADIGKKHFSEDDNGFDGDGGGGFAKGKPEDALYPSMSKTT